MCLDSKWLHLRVTIGMCLGILEKEYYTILLLEGRNCVLYIYYKSRALAVKLELYVSVIRGMCFKR